MDNDEKNIKYRAKLSILSELLSYVNIRDRFWTSCPFDEGFQIGDLVSLLGAPISEYYVSWLHEIDINNGFKRYLLESIETNELCWWGNIGLDYYDRERVNANPSWKWTDRQFELNDRWFKVCYKKHKAYQLLPCQLEFNNNKVTLNVRVRFHETDFSNPKKFDNWKKVTIKMMDEYFLESHQKYEQSLKT
jgi:hypothetical protein